VVVVQENACFYQVLYKLYLANSCHKCIETLTSY